MYKGKTQLPKKVGSYILVSFLGKGMFGEVFKAHKESDPGTMYAVKSMSKAPLKKNPMLERLFNTEVGIMTNIRHDNIMPLYDLLETSNNYYLVMRLCSDGDFEKYLEKRNITHVEEKEAIGYLKQIANAFRELQRQKVRTSGQPYTNIFRSCIETSNWRMFLLIMVR
jgi:serine/threonine protein kinase